MIRQLGEERGLVHLYQGVREHFQRRKGRAETPGTPEGARGAVSWLGWQPLESGGLDQATSGVWPGSSHHDQGLS